MKRGYFKSFIMTLVFAVAFTTMGSNFVFAMDTKNEVDGYEVLDNEITNLDAEVLFKAETNEDAKVSLDLKVDSELSPEANIDLDLETNEGNLNGSWIDENGTEQQGAYKILIENENWVLTDTVTGEVYTISDSEIKASAWWIPVLILVAKIGKAAAKAKKLKVDEALKHIPKNTKVMNDKALKKAVGDVHAFKKEYIEDGTPVSRFDVHVDKSTGRLWLFEKQGAKRKIPTYKVI